jgi:hypothetical protein
MTAANVALRRRRRCVDVASTWTLRWTATWTSACLDRVEVQVHVAVHAHDHVNVNGIARVSNRSPLSQALRT